TASRRPVPGLFRPPAAGTGRRSFRNCRLRRRACTAAASPRTTCVHRSCSNSIISPKTILIWPDEYTGQRSAAICRPERVCTSIRPNRKYRRQDGSEPILSRQRSVMQHGADGLALVQQIEGFVDVLELQVVGDE